MATKPTKSSKPAAKSSAKSEAPAKSAAPAKGKKTAAASAAHEIDPRLVLGGKHRFHSNGYQIDFGYFQLKQSGKIVGEVVVSQYTNGVIVPGQSMEYYYLYKASSGSYAPFTWPSSSNSPCTIEYVYTAGGPPPTFNPVAYQYQQPVENQLIACTCVDMGTVKP